MGIISEEGFTMNDVDKLIELVMRNDITFEEAMELIEALEDERESSRDEQEVVGSSGSTRNIA